MKSWTDGVRATAAARHLLYEELLLLARWTPKRMALTNTRSLTRPAKDEWGVYDPQQAGIAALFARLDAREPKAATAAGAPATKTETPEAVPAPQRPTLGDAR